MTTDRPARKEAAVKPEVAATFPAAGVQTVPPSPAALAEHQIRMERRYRTQ